MTRALVITLALLAAAAPFDAASAQDRGRFRDQERPRQEQVREQRDQPRRISEAEAQSIAQSRARGARFVGSRGMRGDSYVFLFERDGQVMEIAVSSSGN